jgi:hypothetical protein
MTQGKRVEVSAVQRADIWRRWQAGESLHEIGHTAARIPRFICCYRITGGSFQRFAGGHREPSH